MDVNHVPLHIQNTRDAFTARFLARLPPPLAASFSTEQLDAIRREFGMRYRLQHAVDLRRTLHLPWGRFYVVLLCGRDGRRDGWRGCARLLLDTLGFGGALLGLAALLAAAGVAVSLLLPDGAMVLAAGF